MRVRRVAADNTRHTFCDVLTHALELRTWRRWRETAMLLAYCLALALGAAAGAVGSGPEAFCDQYLSPENNGTELHWGKTLNNFDFATVERSKCLYCCAKGASSILWFKDGLPLEMTGEDDFKPSAGRGNDTIVTLRVLMYHDGKYSCEASNGSHQLVHNITLHVDVEKYFGKPIPTAVPKDQYAEIGESTEMFCEAFIGEEENTIAMSSVIWTKVGEEGKFASREGGRTIEYTWRDDKQIIGAYLRFHNITAEDFGTYTCKIDNNQPDVALIFNANLTNGVDPNIRVKYQATYQSTLVILAVFVACFVATVATAMHWRLEIRLFWKDHFGKLEDDGKEYDVFVCYDADDADFALGVLVATLEQKFHYHCFAHERDSIAGDLILETYCSRIRASRRFLIVLSPSLANNAWCTYALYVAVNAMLNLKCRIICVILQNVSWPAVGEAQRDPILQHVLRVVKKIRWEAEPRRPFPLLCGDSQDKMLPRPSTCHTGSPRFWTTLRIMLPPRKPSSAVV